MFLDDPNFSGSFDEEEEAQIRQGEIEFVKHAQGFERDLIQIYRDFFDIIDFFIPTQEIIITRVIA